MIEVWIIECHICMLLSFEYFLINISPDDATPSTIFHPPSHWLNNPMATEPVLLTPHLLQQVLPDVKLIVMLRDPTDR